MEPRDSLQNVLDRTANLVYDRCCQIQQRFLANVPLIVVEGQSQRHQPHFDQYFKDYELIKDWRAALLNQQSLPYTPLLVMLSQGTDILDKFNNKISEKSQWLKDAEIVMDMMKNSEQFPDNCHPGDEAHAELTERLCRMIDARAAKR